jgi:hypothetical protein
MLNYPAMNSLRGLVLALLLFPLQGLGQGVRMSADFLPLDVGKTWTYELTNPSGQKVGQIAYAVEDYTIVEGTSFYVLSGFPFTNETGEPIELVRYDRTERYFIRRLRNNEGPLFLADGATTEVTEADAAGSPQKFVLRMDGMALTFQRGVGIVEARLEQPTGTVTAKLVAAPRSTSGGAAPAPAPAPATGASAAKQPVIIPAPVEPIRREPPVAAVTSDNPRLDVGVVPEGESYRIVMIVTNTADKLLPFQFRSSQTYDFVIHDAASNREVWRWSNGNFFTQVVRSEAIRAGGKWQFEVVWNRKDNDGMPVPAGQYRVTGMLMSSPPAQAAPVALELP